MKSWIAWAIAVVVSVAGAAWGQDAGPATRPTSRPALGPTGLMGTVAKVEGKDLIVTPMRGWGDGKDVVLETNEQTTFMVDYEMGTLDDLKPGMNIRVMVRRGIRGRPDRAIVTATSTPLVGAVVKVEGLKVVVFGRVDRSWSEAEAMVQENGKEVKTTIRFRRTQPPEEPKEWTVQTDERTKVLFVGAGREPGKIGALDELKPDMRVHVIPVTGTATKIVVTPARGGPMNPLLPFVRPG